MNTIFNSVKLTRPPKNSFDLRHDVKLSFNMGYLVPVMNMEVIPGDTCYLGCESLTRFAPMVSPIMHRVNVKFDDYFVPYRLLWDGWEAFIKNEPGAPAFPTLPVDHTTFTKLHDYMGIPTPPNPTIAAETISALHFAAYQFVYNEMYRDQNLIAKVAYKLVDGDNSGNAELTVLRKVAWEHDYFTAALPFAQKGSAVSIPLGDLPIIPVAYNNAVDTTLTGAPNNIPVSGQIAPTPPIPANTLYADGTGQTLDATNVTDLRRAYALQRFLEKAARFGTRYKELIMGFFGVKSPDQRLQRPEFIYRTTSPVVISEVVNTTGTDDLPQGNMSGHGASVTAGNKAKYFVQEHGVIIRMMFITPRTAYQQGIPKHFLKHTDPFQFYWPEFAHIGEQAVEEREIYAYQNGGSDTFGYVPRYSEYKYMPSRVSGDFRTSLNTWHMARIFGSKPLLNQAFVEADPTFRIFAVTSDAVDHMWCHVLNDVRMSRSMPRFADPY